MDERTLHILLTMRNYLLIEPHEISNFINKYKIQKQYYSIIERFMLAKWNFFSSSIKYKFSIVSLGINCLPHTLSIWNGLKLPNYIYNKKRMFFDMCVSNGKTAFEILSNKVSSPYVDAIKTINNRRMFVSLRFNCRYNHDSINETLSDSENIYNFNVELEKRVAELNKCKDSEPCLFFYDDNNEDYVNMIYNSIIADNPKNKLLVTSTNNFNNIDKNNICFINRQTPYKDYVWHLKAHNLTDIGYNYEYMISSNILEFIKDNFEEDKEYLQNIKYILSRSKSVGMEIFTKNISNFHEKYF